MIRCMHMQRKIFTLKREATPYNPEKDYRGDIRTVEIQKARTWDRLAQVSGSDA